MEQIERPTHGGAPALLSAEFNRWNWGAFGLSWIWGIANRTPAAWFVFVPFVGWFGMPFLLGLKGNEWAWRNGNWQDIETFRRAQRLWARRALFAWTGAAVAVVLISTLTTSILARSEPFRLAQIELAADPKLIEHVGHPIELGIPTGSLNAKAGGTGDAQLKFSVSGPKGEGKAYVSAQKQQGAWQLQRATVELENGMRIERLLSTGPSAQSSQ
jgi:hypothetical protein